MGQYCQKGCWFIFVCVYLIVVAGCANQTSSLSNNNLSLEPAKSHLSRPQIEPANEPKQLPLTTASTTHSATADDGKDRMETPPTKNLWLKSAKADLLIWPDRFIEDSKDTFFKKSNILALLLAGGASIAMNQGADKDTAEYFQRHEVFHSFTDRSLKTLGNPGLHFAATGLWYLFSIKNQDEFNKQRALTMVTALAVNGLTTIGLKAIRDDETPVGNKWAWPSGHTSSSFTIASVLDEFYGPKVGIPAYALASLVGLRMMDQGDHWASDVVFGATLGWVVGHTIAGKHKKLEVAGFKVLPFTTTIKDSPAMGVSLVKRF